MKKCTSQVYTNKNRNTKKKKNNNNNNNNLLIISFTASIEGFQKEMFLQLSFKNVQVCGHSKLNW